MHRTCLTVIGRIWRDQGTGESGSRHIGYDGSGNVVWNFRSRRHKTMCQIKILGETL